jgi:hypothetical protein
MTRKESATRQLPRCYGQFRAFDAEAPGQAQHLRQTQAHLKREISGQLFFCQSPYGVKPKSMSSLHGVNP